MGRKYCWNKYRTITMEDFAIFGHVMRNYLKRMLMEYKLCMATAVVAHKTEFWI